MMSQNEVLDLFKSEAATLEKAHARNQDTVVLLAEVIAHCSTTMLKEDLDSLIHIGGTLVKNSDTQLRARSEVAATMKESHDSAFRSQS
jgi:hypothetical protein